MNNENETLCEEVSFNKAYLINVQAANLPTINAEIVMMLI
jgi:hypothetical protein